MSAARTAGGAARRVGERGWRRTGDRGPRGAGERGSVTAEFAVVLPVAVTLLAAALTTVIAVDAHGRLVLAAAAASRAFGRDDDAAAHSAVAAIVPGAELASSGSGGIVCAEVARRTGIALVVPGLGAARVCAAAGGR